MTGPSSPPGRGVHFRVLIILPLFAAGLLWASWPSLVQMFDRWTHDPRYSHGFLVPAFSAFLLWHRRGLLRGRPLGTSAWGFVLVVAGAALQVFGGRYYIPWFAALSLLPSLAGVALLVGGPPSLRWAWPSIAFLFFMIPLPYRVEMALGSPLQRVATLASNYALQTLGMPAVAEGNVILIEDRKIGVVEACNGLGMLFTFIAIATGVALVIPNDPLDKALIVASSAPIALLANVTRITMTGVLYVTVSGRVADVVYHDLAGWLMMPMALVAILVELKLLSHLLLAPEAGAPRPIRP